ncbi:hypothetical protein [Altericista sp. CCNU0014]|uniref:hypothetical protein n=1 Tax=Altericista sp. CCNU0014 TaxID=3082949 RepID=UPI00384BA269
MRRSGSHRTFDRTARLHPEDPDIYGNRCAARYRPEDFEGAISDCEQVSAVARAARNSEKSTRARDVKQASTVKIEADRARNII